jgi:ribosomal protein S18 acetylase RimI-like enzyme
MGATDVQFRFFFRMAMALLVIQVSSLQTTMTQALTIKPVQTAKDVADLAELRYNEWMILPSDQHQQQKSPSRAAFGAATAEIIQERTGATPFLARNEDRQPVGAAELSSVELEGVISKDTTSSSILYVTDVVTSQAHRRQGIAQALMVALEEAARERGTQCLLLHVKPDNHGALAFYQSRLGYHEPTDTLLEQWDLNLERLTENTATRCQILLCKELVSSPPNTDTNTTRKKKTASAGAGFGGSGGTKPKKRAK